MASHPVAAKPRDLETGLEPLGPPVEYALDGPDTPRKSSHSSTEHTQSDEHALVRANTFTDGQFEELRQTLSRRSTVGGDPLDIEHNFNLEKYVREIVQRSDKQGVKSRHAGVLFRNISTYGVGAGVSFQKTILDPLSAPLRLREIVSGFRAPTKQIIHSFSGVVKAGEMLLVREFH